MHIPTMRSRQTLAIAALVVAWSLLSLLTFAPLRIGTDSIRLFAMSLPAACGGAYGIDQFPPFYPHLLCLLMKLGWCNNVVLIGINFLSLGTGLIILGQINRRSGFSWGANLVIITAVLMNWIVAKHTLIPQTDILLLPFFWGTVFALLYYRDASSIRRKILWAVISIALACIAVSIRTAAVALFGLIAVALSGVTLGNVKTVLRKKSFWLIFGISVAIIAIGTFLAIRYTEFAAKGGYFSMFCNFMSAGPLAVLAMVYGHLFDLAQLILNAPERVLPKFIQIPCVIVTSILFVFALIHQLVRNKIEWYVFVILIGYGLEIFLWPCVDPRFFLPILPFVLHVIIRGLLDVLHNRKHVLIAFLVVVSVLGAAAWGKLAYDWTRDDFSCHTAFPKLALAYKNALKDVSEVPPSERSLPLFILKKFDLRYAQKNLPLNDYINFNADYSYP